MTETSPEMSSWRTPSRATSSGTSSGMTNLLELSQSSVQLCSVIKGKIKFIYQLPTHTFIGDFAAVFLLL